MTSRQSGEIKECTILERWWWGKMCLLYQKANMFDKTSGILYCHFAEEEVWNKWIMWGNGSIQTNLGAKSWNFQGRQRGQWAERVRGGRYSKSFTLGNPLKSYTAPNRLWHLKYNKVTASSHWLCFLGENTGGSKFQFWCLIADVCSLPKVSGPCFAYFHRWWYNKKIKQCTGFIFGGCKGNANNFQTKDICQSYCLPKREFSTVFNVLVPGRVMLGGMGIG